MIIENKKEFVRKLIIGTFTTIPFISSLISTFHLISLFSLGNTSLMSWGLAIAFEVGSIASLLILTILDKINKGMVMTIFFILMLMQILGNLYYSFDYINQHLNTDPSWLGSFQELISYFVDGNLVLVKLVAAVLVSTPVPLISLFFLKSMVDYLKFDEPKIQEMSSPNNEEEIVMLDEVKKIDNLPPAIEQVDLQVEQVIPSNNEPDIPTIVLESGDIQIYKETPETQEIKPIGPSNVAVFKQQNDMI